ncbi:MAG: hypothetical protein A2X61_15055 [Ignavibacteria bacterium GWB2_35_12]|nr:MAG: hypothetical protein A2X63_12285 [Ignavibacteria bacterium GWA2_35_8]OGU41784.1 MAG: hypothetical protein A2X61_15055 [Ignavibacteria bacterium GWB2_35_12]OGU86102.1 MAG: hypothetical protein A2220_06620 [Ignavibacteria bacterium RIFOXYA2_FULL_35_10]OGV24357.1 MAG: hypothetical protein A2475_05300 [Ignavibacteria bacterium RIFOXYC2_FULL_35_21]
MNGEKILSVGCWVLCCGYIFITKNCQNFDLFDLCDWDDFYFVHLLPMNRDFRCTSTLPFLEEGNFFLVSDRDRRDGKDTN